MTSQSLEPTNGQKPRRPNAAALKALEKAIYQQTQGLRWRIVAENAPTGSKVSARAHDEWQKAITAAFDNYQVVRIALGYDPEDDGPGPKRHWDAGA